MKKYVKPILRTEEFVPQEYIAACGDSGVKYLFECDAGGGVYGGVWQETNKVPGLQLKSGKYLGKKYKPDKRLSHDDDSFHACGETHEAATDSEFIKGCYYKADYDEADVLDVIVWKGLNNDNVHATTNLNMNSWETTKS